MLGWMLRGGDHAPNAPDAEAQEDATRVELPDTPAPVFAARALKSALFGTPARADDSPRRQKTKASRRTSTMAKADKGSSGTPSKPPGILLTPGTGTSRRKRVSFGQQVTDFDPTGGNGGATQRADTVAKPTTDAGGATSKAADDTDDDWEEEDDDGCCTHDVTLDLNEPHSQSGRYWKGQFERYHQEAKAEMEKLLKYKQLAKSYARQKDAEAVRLSERLRDERQRVIKMEMKIADNASQIVSRHGDNGPDGEPTELLAKLTKQTALAADYRQRVHDLETKLDDVVRQKEQSAEASGRRRRVATTASPTTQKTLLETQRELRRARVQLKELDSLRHEVSLLKTRVKTAETRAHAGDKQDVDESMSTRHGRLRTQLDESREEGRQKAEELRQLKHDFEAFKKESEAHEAETRAVLQRAHSKISDLKKEMRVLKAADTGKCRPSGRCPSPDDNGLEARRDKTAQDGRSRGRDVTGKDSNSKRSTEEGALTERTNAERPRWQPFVARSPRVVRGSSDQGQSGSGRWKPGAEEQPVRPQTKSNSQEQQQQQQQHQQPGRTRRKASDDDDDDDDDVDDVPRCKPEANDEAKATTKRRSSVLPPDRRAAALARIESRLEEKRRRAHDKENRRP
ncbi:hypothetical protein XA68_14109 [Ophiocordyceps unilateralis]|uniref:Spindle pole body-associated protein cut12 domain-containing protein n=1 Tax=Ophiocordyceps unilateralis TaxID=268505 RepID=A0A2A9PB54_OPHUN|nr:hypothetical protein XA68_14109 [Ophiocordyceps unilateralis]